MVPEATFVVLIVVVSVVPSLIDDADVVRVCVGVGVIEVSAMRVDIVEPT